VPVSRLTSASSQKYSSSHSMRQHINELVVTDGEQIICVPPQQDLQLAASLGSNKSHVLAMFQVLTGCDTASVLNLLDMDTNYMGCLPWNSSPELVTLHVHSLTSKNTSVLHSCMCRGFHQHTLLWNSMSRVLSSRVIMFGVISMSHNLCSLLRCMGQD